jgi:hypothetical protein
VDLVWKGRREQVRVGRRKNSRKTRSRTNKDEEKKRGNIIRFL